MKEALCKAFCDEITVREVPAGLAVGTGFGGIGDDPVGFYILGPDDEGNYRVEDNGLTVAIIEASGADFGVESRNEAFRSLLDIHAASYDEDHGELFIDNLSRDSVPSAALRFVALLMRVQDIMLMASERAASTFKEDALRSIREHITNAQIQEGEAVHPSISEFTADVVLRRTGALPVAVIFAMTNQRVLEAVLMQTLAQYEAKIECNVVALLENDRFLSQKTRQQASNRLAAMPIYRGDEEQSIRQIERQLSMVH